MTVRAGRCRTAVSRAVWIAVMLALTPLPLLASGAATPKTTGIRASMERIAAREIAAPLKPAVRAARQTQTPGGSPGFFKTRPGMVALAVMIAGTGYAVYSAQHDRIHSPGKK